MCLGTTGASDKKDENDQATAANTTSTSKNERPPNAFESANCWSRFLFTWPYPLLRLGLQRPLNERDLPHIPHRDGSQAALFYFVHHIWQPGQNLRTALLRDFLCSTWMAQPLMCAAAISKVAQAFALGRLIDFFQSKNDGSSSDGWMWASVLIGCATVILFEHHHLFFLTWKKGMQIRIYCLAALYDKSLSLASSTLAPSSILNLASNDVERFLMAALFLNYLFWAPIQSLGVLGVGWYLLGPAFVIGFAVLMVCFIPLQFYLGAQFARYRSKIARHTDHRVDFVSQVIRGIRLMKLSGYEEQFVDRIAQLRGVEIGQIQRTNRLKCYNETLFFCTNVVISVLIFLVHVHLGNTLNEGDVFTVFTLINILQLEMTKNVSLGVMAVSECWVSIGRIQAYLQLPELPTKQRSPLADSSKILQLQNLSCDWHLPGGTNSTQLEQAKTRAVANVSLQFEPSSITAVIGPVGCGKSALLSAIVQELPTASGLICMSESTTMSYAGQDPWIMDGSVMDNITMGNDFREDWYNQVVECCGLKVDLEHFANGDKTMLGENGVQCSGGQRARIGLARSLYRDADILVADDPLSAVDAKVGRQLFQDALFGLVVNRGKCVILATHQHQFVHGIRCVLVQNGHVQTVGSYQECVDASGGKLAAHLADADTEESAEPFLMEPSEDATMLGCVDTDNSPLTDDHLEISNEGLLDRSTYVQYIQYVGIWATIFLFALFSVTTGSVLVTMVMIGKWSERSLEQQEDPKIQGLVIGLAGSVIVFALIRAFLSFHFAIKASQRLHDRMTRAVLRSKIQFFDTNPLGRIVNRFSADVGITDDQLPHTLFDFFMLAFIVLGALVTTVSTLPFVLLALPFLGWYFWSVRRVFVTSSRELKRLEGVARSPIFSMLSESLTGIATIRSNDSMDFFRRKFRQVHDTHTRCFFSFIAASRWVGFRMDSLVFFMLVSVSLLSVLFHSQGWFDVDPSILGLSLSLLLQLAGLFQWCVRQSAEVVNQMVSVERVLAFGAIESEPELVRDADQKRLDAGWPTRGQITVRDLSIRYRPSLPLVLQDVSFSIPADSRVGVVGRTGSGKSTIVQSLFRLLEPESGKILIDGIDIAELGLHTLRTNLSVIPQSPTLFSGCTIRDNLDLFGAHSNESLSQVIRDCHLSEFTDKLPLGLDTPVSEGGSNFSVGERQLLCLARAILSRNKIVIMDEATASVDRRTDQLLQAALHQSFRKGTIFAVAHRLDTIIDYDYCLVLGGGKVLEFGKPANLIRIGGAFASMVNDTGDAMSSELKQRAFAKERNDPPLSS